MTGFVADVLVRPRRFVEDVVDAPPRVGPVALVALTGGITLAAQLLLVSMTVRGDGPTLSYVATAVRVTLPAMNTLGAAISFGHVFVYWLAYVALFYVASEPFADDDDDLSTLFWVSGWGFLPWFLAGVVWLVSMIASAQIVHPPATSAGNAAFVRQVQDTVLVDASQSLDHVATAWSLGIWTVAVAVVRDLPYSRAAIAVAPVAAFEVAKVVLG